MKSIKFSILLLAAGLVAAVSCGKSDGPEVQPQFLADPANCFLISKPGLYTFKPFKGKTHEAVGAVASVEVLWESFGTATAPAKGDIVAETYYKDGQIYFKTNSGLKDGNAVIAAKDADKNIIWSWHIWVCAGYDPAANAQKYYNKHNSAKFTSVMDRNLGATSAAINDLKSHGLLYQWGRKDPFLGWNGVENHVRAASTITTWPTQVLSDATTGTIEYATAHPTTIIYSSDNSNNGDWYYSAVYAKTDDTRWNEKKDLYDPCPAGWTLPQAHTAENEGLWFNALENEWVVIENWDKTRKGFDCTGVLGDAASIWYPFTSLYGKEDGNLYASVQINIWSSDVSTLEGDTSAETFNGDINAQEHFELWAATHSARSCGLNTRCVAVE